MFCEKCGTELKEGAMFCQGCGTKVTQQSVPVEPVQPVQPEWQQPAQPAQEWQQPLEPQEWVYNSKKKGKAGKTIAIIVALLVIIGGGIFAATQLFGGHKKAIEEFLDVYMKDGKKMVLLMAPKDVLKESAEEQDKTLEDFYDETQQYCDLISERMEANDIKYNFKIKKSESLKKLDDLEEAAEDRGVGSLDDFRDMMDESMGKYGLDADKITSAYIYEIEVTTTQDGEKEKGEMYAVAYKYKGKWYIYPGSM